MTEPTSPGPDAATPPAHGDAGEWTAADPAVGEPAAVAALGLGHPGATRKFAVMRRPDSRWYILGGALSMMADNVEHVLSYWVLWQTFHSPLLVGFQIVSHWLPFLLLSVYAGALAERFDCRRLIQLAQGLFMLVSLCWGLLFLTGTLQLWHACVLLVLHGMAGCLWAPAEQMMLYDFAGPRELTSAVRLNATFRSLAFLLGPVVGSALLVGLGPTTGIFINIALYLPLTLFLLRTKFTGHVRSGALSSRRMTLVSAFKVLGTVRRDRVLLGMMLLAALGAVTLGAVLQNAMPVFAGILDAGEPGLAYGMLLFALGAGGVAGGFLLEATGWVPANPKTAVIAAIVLGATAVLFTLSGDLLLGLLALLIAGFANITCDSTEMSIVQLRAPDAERGRVIGAYSMFGPGMRTFSGVTVAVLGALAGIPNSVLIGGAVLALGAVAIGLFVRSDARPKDSPPDR